MDIGEPDYDDPKEPYALYGLAAYFAQCFEQSLILLIVAGEIIRQRNVPDLAALDELFAKLSKRTLGQLINTVSQVMPIDDVLADAMVEALKKRNYLVHHFFFVNAEKWFNGESRRMMIDELRGLVNLFKSADVVAKSIYSPLCTKLGISEDVINKTIVSLGIPSE
ncbi:MAG: hypothetical protein JO001_19725 [Alphaproteobacteria bacterium]|nr:hypothetical protein [Alphaproteobacteria bacterium]